MKSISILLAVLMVAMLACTLISPAGSPAPTLPVPITPLQTALPPTQTVEPAAGGSDCLPFQEGVAFEPNLFPDYSQAILEFLNQGGKPDDLAAALKEAEAANPSQVAAIDFTGDGLNDIGVSYYDLTMETPESLLNIYVCQDEHYTLVYRDGSGAEGFLRRKQLWVWQDLDANGPSELVASDTHCGAHTCFASVKILAWDGNSFVNKLAGTTDDLPSPDVQVTDADGDGVFDLEVVAGGIASVGAGPQRSLTRVWVYDPAQDTWAEERETLGPSNFRIHVLHDADAAAKRGDYEAALALYDRVIHDEELDDWVDPPTERANLSAFAMYRLVMVYLVLGQNDLAETVLAEMQSQFPPDSAQVSYVGMAVLFQDTFSSGGLETACPAAMGYAAANMERILAPLGTMVFGYGNPDYTVEEMCLE